LQFNDSASACNNAVLQTTRITQQRHSVPNLVRENLGHEAVLQFLVVGSHNIVFHHPMEGTYRGAYIEAVATIYSSAVINTACSQQ